MKNKIILGIGTAGVLSAIVMSVHAQISIQNQVQTAPLQIQSVNTAGDVILSLPTPNAVQYSQNEIKRQLTLIDNEITTYQKYIDNDNAEKAVLQDALDQSQTELNNVTP